MAAEKCGKHSFRFNSPPVITTWACVGGAKEFEGPLGYCLDGVTKGTSSSKLTWEQKEQQLQKETLEKLAQKAGCTVHDFELVLSGDLLNQCIGSSFALRNSGIAHLGLYGACSTMAESMLIGSVLASGGCFDNVVAMTSSCFPSAEKQYRFPLGYGGQRTPTAQWTVTGSGAVRISRSGCGPLITSATVGSIVDLGICDANNMGAAMAPAALNTITMHFLDTGSSPDDYDLIITGDLGQVGKELLAILAQKQGIKLGGKLMDCGTMIFDPLSQDVHAGGSGCGCSAVVMCGYFLEKLLRKKYKRILFCGTGALLSPISIQQGLSIPGVCHAVSIEGAK